jgi:hypothetical protein
MQADFLELLKSLRANGGDFVIVGGVAALLHGGTRVTFDLEVVPALDPDSWSKTIDYLWGLGARPRIPEPLGAIRDPEKVAAWIDEKGMLALNMRSPDGSVEVDFLVSESKNFAQLNRHAVKVAYGGHIFPVASIDDLIEMKRKAGRPQDLIDIRSLEEIRRRSM